MATKSIHNVLNKDTTKQAMVFFNKDLGEYMVKFYVKGVHQVDADYFDDDKQSAIGTANHFCKDGV